MMKSRKKFDAAFKAKIALEALREDATASRSGALIDLASWPRNPVRPSVGRSWRKAWPVERPGKELSVRRRRALVGVARSGSTAPSPSLGRTIWREVDVAEQRRNHPALRNALFPAGFEHDLQQVHDVGIVHALATFANSRSCRTLSK